MTRHLHVHHMLSAEHCKRGGRGSKRCWMGETDYNALANEITNRRTLCVPSGGGRCSWWSLPRYNFELRHFWWAAAAAATSAWLQKRQPFTVLGRLIKRVLTNSRWNMIMSVLAGHWWSLNLWLWNFKNFCLSPSLSSLSNRTIRWVWKFLCELFIQEP